MIVLIDKLVCCISNVRSCRMIWSTKHLYIIMIFTVGRISQSNFGKFLIEYIFAMRRTFHPSLHGSFGIVVVGRTSSPKDIFSDTCVPIICKPCHTLGRIGTIYSTPVRQIPITGHAVGMVLSCFGKFCVKGQFSQTIVTSFDIGVG